MSMTVVKNAQRVMKKLRQQGCILLEAKEAPRRAIINIEAPTAEMMVNATVIKQSLNGVESMIYITQIDGCTVSWKGGEACSIH